MLLVTLAAAPRRHCLHYPPVAVWPAPDREASAARERVRGTLLEGTLVHV